MHSIEIKFSDSKRFDRDCLMGVLAFRMEKPCYRLALKPPAGPIHIHKLTFRLLEPLGAFGRL